MKITGFKSGVAIKTASLKTYDKATSIKAVVIKDSTGTSNIVEIPITIVDKEGNTVYDATNEISVLIKGNASLLGLESGSSTSHENYKSNKRKALHGKLMAYLIMKKNIGNTSIEFSSPGLTTQKIFFK